MNLASSTVGKLPVMEHFYTIQGEGAYQGVAAYFVRLGGCDVGCPWCDVKESWEADAHPKMEVSEIVDLVKNCEARICVITGGEPLLHNLETLTKSLHKIGVRTHIETSGSSPMSGHWDWICLSPKRYKLPLEPCIKAAHELKVIISHRNDLRFAEEFAAQVDSKCVLFLQPEWSKEEEVLPMIIDYVKENQQWRISLQVHKYMNIP